MSNPFAKPGGGGGGPPSIPSRGTKSGESEPEEVVERTLIVKGECLVYRIPPQTKAAGWKANDWNLKKPDWSGKMRLVNISFLLSPLSLLPAPPSPQVTMGKGAKIRLEEKDNDNLFRECPVETYPGLAIQSVTDSSRYFVIKVNEDGKNVYLGLGFEDRSDSFDLNSTLHDYFKGLLVEEKIEQEKEAPPEKLDLALKQGETIKVSINLPTKKSGARSKSAGARGGGAMSSLPAALGPAGSIPAPPSPAMAKLNIASKPPPAPTGGSRQWIQF